MQAQLRFGPAGNSASFYAQGYKRTEQAPAWLAPMGLTALEYSAGRGVVLKDDTAERIGREALQHGIAVSIHAPYYINLANPDPERFQRNLGYILDSARVVDKMGGHRVVLHAGSTAKRDPAEAFSSICDGLRVARHALVDAGYAHIALCPETMGRDNQVGDVEDILRLCELDESFVPAIDFAHVHARMRGGLTRTEDFARILDRMQAVLGPKRGRSFHAHFCRIEYTGAGEKRHWTFADTQFGPDFALLAPLVAARKLTATFICESSGTMAEDACAMAEMVRHAAQAAHPKKPPAAPGRATRRTHSAHPRA